MDTTATTRWLVTATISGISEPLGHSATRDGAAGLMTKDAESCVSENGAVTFEEREGDILATYADGTEIVYVIEPFEAAVPDPRTVVNLVEEDVAQLVAELRERQVPLSTERPCSNGRSAYLEIRTSPSSSGPRFISVAKCVGSRSGKPEWVAGWETALTVDEAHTLIDRLNAAIREIGGEE